MPKSNRSRAKRLHSSPIDLLEPRFMMSSATRTLTYPPPVPFNPSTNADAILSTAVAPDGKLYILGNESSGAGVVERLNSNLTVDTTFGTNGAFAFSVSIPYTPTTFQNLAVASDDSVYVVQDNDLIHLTSAGVMDPNFNGGQPVFFGDSHIIGYFNTGAIAIDPNGNVLIAGQINNGPVAIKRFNSAGVQDMSFGTNGLATSGGGSATTPILRIQPSGKIILLTHSAILRFNTNGTPDLTFGNLGEINVNAGGAGPYNYSPFDLRLESDGSIVFLNSYGDYYQGQITSISLYRPDGVNVPVTLTNNNSNGLPEFTAFAVTPNNKLLFSTVYQVMQLNADGTPDSSFGVNGNDVLPFTFVSNTTVQSISILPTGTPVVALDHINDVIRSGLISLDERPNLTVTGLSVLDGPGLDATVQTSIRGNLGTQPPALRIVLSTDAILGNGDDIVLKNAMPTTPTDGKDYQLATAGVADGSYNLFAVLDPNNAFAESDETDNSLMVPVTISSTDLTISINSADASAFSGGVLQCDATVNNSGPNVQSYINAAAVLSQDTIYGNSDDFPLSINGLQANAGSTDVLLSGNVPTMPAGSYHILARIDSDSVVRDTNPSNNTIVGPTVSINPAPDLAIAQITCDDTAYAGSILSYHITPGGSITFPNNVPVSLYLSRDTVFGNSDDILLTSTAAYVPTTSQTNDGVNLPDALPGGTFYLLAVVDPAGTISESNRANNVTVSPSLIVVPNTPAGDLGISLVSLASGTGPNSFTLSYRLSDSFANLSPLTVGVYASTSSTFDSSATLLTSQNVNPAAATSTLSFSLQPASKLSPGSYYVFVVADPNNAVLETDETNNAGTAGTSLTVSAPPSVPDRTSTLGLVRLGSKSRNLATTTITFTNYGNAAAIANVNVTYVLSTSTKFTDAVHTFPVQHYTASLAAGGSKSFPVALTLPAVRKTGSYYIVAHALSTDDGDDLSNNDAASAAIKLTGPNVVLKAALGAFAKGQQTITLTNKGKDAAKDKVKILLQASKRKSQNGAVSFTPFTKALNLLPGKSITFTIRAAGAVVHGSEFVIASIFYPFDNTAASAILFSAKAVKFA